MRHSGLFIACTFLCASLAVAQDAKPPAPAASKITYDEHVRPILREHCFSCHSADKQESGLQLDSYQKAMAECTDLPLAVSWWHSRHFLESTLGSSGTG